MPRQNTILQLFLIIFHFCFLMFVKIHQKKRILPKINCVIPGNIVCDCFSFLWGRWFQNLLFLLRKSDKFNFITVNLDIRIIKDFIPRCFASYSSKEEHQSRFDFECAKITWNIFPA